MKEPETFRFQPSPILRAAIELAPSVRDRAFKIARDTLSEVLNTEGVAESIIKDAEEHPGQTVSRPVDLRNEDGEIQLCAFISWDTKKEIWTVYLEGSQENHFGKEGLTKL